MPPIRSHRRPLLRSRSLVIVDPRYDYQPNALVSQCTFADMGYSNNE
jgi:hypothetical protein